MVMYNFTKKVGRLTPPPPSTSSTIPRFRRLCKQNHFLERTNFNIEETSQLIKYKKLF